METIAAEREASKLDIEQLSCLIYEEELLKRKREIETEVANNPKFDIKNYYYLEREELFAEAMRKRVYGLMKHQKELDIVGTLEHFMYTFAVGGENPLALNSDVFVPAIGGQGDHEQQAKWLPLASQHKIIGCYAQTEMGHGTYVRGLETTATYDPVKQEFDVHSPTLTSIKWWPGTMGVNATHGIVVARLITKGVDRGIHHFIVQLRSLKDHRPMKGIEIGDIGPKFGYQEMDNGFLKLNHVRIPRENMLMRYAQVEPDGTYVNPKSDKLSYGAMVFVRTALARFSFISLGRAVTIAIRYSIVRRQTQNKPGQPETQLLDYTNQQYKLIPLLASAYAFFFISQYILDLYGRVQSQLADEDIGLLPELHASSSGVKALTTTIASNGIEMCRVSCGGHGYSLSSGFPYIYGSLTPATTYEGDNTVLLLQTARYLIKIRREVKENPNYAPPENVNYLSDRYEMFPRPDSPNFLSTRDQLHLFRVMVRASVERAAAKVREGEGRGLDYFDAWNASAIQLIQCAEAHTYYVIVKSFIETLDRPDVKSLTIANQYMLKCLSDVFCLHYVLEKSGVFIESGVLLGSDLDELRHVFVSLLREVRPEAVSLVDAFDFPDFVLRSVLGRKDGDVYRAMWDWVQLNPRNKHKHGVHPVYKKYISKLTKAKL